MTEADKQNALDMIAVRIAKADHHGLKATAQSWRDYYVSIAERPAEEIVAARDFTFEPTEIASWK